MSAQELVAGDNEDVGEAVTDETRPKTAAEAAQDPRYKQVFWVKLSGFPPWPARRSLASEWNPSVDAHHKKARAGTDMVFFFGSHDYTSIFQKNVIKSFDQHDSDLALGRIKAASPKRSQQLTVAIKEAAKWFELPVTQRQYPVYTPSPDISSADDESDTPEPARPRKGAKKTQASSGKQAAPAPRPTERDEEEDAPGTDASLGDVVYPRLQRTPAQMRKRVWRRRVQRRIGLNEQNNDSVARALSDATKVSFKRPSSKKPAAAVKAKVTETASKGDGALKRKAPAAKSDAKARAPKKARTSGPSAKVAVPKVSEA